MRLCGSEARMLAGVEPPRRANWRASRQVPAGHVLRIFEARVIEAGEAPPAAPAVTAGRPPVRLPWSQRERQLGTEIAWRMILLTRDHPEQARAVVALIRAMRALSPAEADVLHHLDFQVQGGAQ